MKIVADHHIPYIQTYFSQRADLTLLPGREINHAACQDADILLVRSVTSVNEALLRGTNVKFVGTVTAGHDHLDTAWLEKADIQWAAARGFNAPPVADYVVSCVAALMRQKQLPNTSLKAAVIGVGHVGRCVVEKLERLNIEVIVCDPIRAEQEKDFQSYALSEIADVDIVTVHVPLTREGDHPTHHFIGKDFFDRQKPGCVFINASRGAVVHSREMMQFGSHLLWCLDVWEHEPSIDLGILKQAFIATPHIAGYSVQSKMRGVDLIYQALVHHGYFASGTHVPMEIPHQTISFANASYHWQEIVLGVFNPMLMTSMMRAQLLSDEHHRGKLFDGLRHDFNYRNELSYTHVKDTSIFPEDLEILKAIGVVV